MDCDGKIHAYDYVLIWARLPIRLACHSIVWGVHSSHLVNFSCYFACQRNTTIDAFTEARRVLSPLVSFRLYYGFPVKRCIRTRHLDLAKRCPTNRATALAISPAPQVHEGVTWVRRLRTKHGDSHSLAFYIAEALTAALPCAGTDGVTYTRQDGGRSAKVLYGSQGATLPDNRGG